jgi:hypothetical protein
MDQTNFSSTPTMTQTVLQHLSVLSNAYFERKEPKKYYIYWTNINPVLAKPKKYIYRPNINRVLAITWNSL